ncbi:MAG TPA: hypothetical protein VGE72_10740 [Azospirillum sp.]
MQTPTPEPRPYPPKQGLVAETAADVAARLATFLAGVPPEAREAAIDAYRKVTRQLLLSRGLDEERAAALIDTVVAHIRAHLARVDRAGGMAAGRA